MTWSKYFFLSSLVSYLTFDTGAVYLSYMLRSYIGQEWENYHLGHTKSHTQKPMTVIHHVDKECISGTGPFGGVFWIFSLYHPKINPTLFYHQLIRDNDSGAFGCVIKYCHVIGMLLIGNRHWRSVHYMDATSVDWELHHKHNDIFFIKIGWKVTKLARFHAVVEQLISLFCVFCVCKIIEETRDELGKSYILL